MSITSNPVRSFSTDRKFYDDKNYPRGMSRSGDYSKKEVFLLEEYGIAFLELSSGKRPPETDEEIQFLKVCRGELSPSTPEEKVWLKYHNNILSPKQFHTLFGRNKVAINPDEVIDDSDDLDDD